MEPDQSLTMLSPKMAAWSVKVREPTVLHPVSEKKMGTGKLTASDSRFSYPDCVYDD